MTARLRLLARETLCTLLVMRTWGGLAAQTAVCAALLTAVGSALETSSALGGETGGVFRSFATPASIAVTAAAVLVTSSIARITQDSLRPGRAAWLAASVTPRLAGCIVGLQTLLVTSAASLVGMTVAIMSARSIGSVSVPTGGGDESVPLRAGAATVVTAAILLAVTVLPSLVAAIRHPYSRPPRGSVPTIVVAALVAGAWAAVAIAVAAPGTDTAADVERAVALTLLSVLLVLVLAVIAARSAVVGIALALGRLGARSSSAVLSVSTSAVAASLTRSTGSTTPTLVATTMVGGLYGVFLIGDDALRIVVSGSSETTVNGPAVLGALTPVVVLCVWSAVTALLTSRPDRGADAGVLRQCGMGAVARARTAAMEGALVAAIGMGLGTAVVFVAVSPLALAARIPASTITVDVLNPVLLAVAITTGAVLTGSSAIATALGGRDRH